MARTLQVKPEYGPTTGQLLSPRWRAASAPVRTVVIVAAALLVAVLIGAVLMLLPAHFVHRGPLSFNFNYRGMYRERPDAGGYARVARHRGGRLTDSFAVEPLTLPDVAGSVTGVLPLAAAAHTRLLEAHDPNFALQSEGKTKINNMQAYAINYSTRVEGREMDGRDVLLVPPVAGARNTVVIVMLTLANPRYTDASPVGGGGSIGGGGGVLHLPESTFSFGA